MKKIMEFNATVVAATSSIAEVDLTHPFGLNQTNHSTSDMGGKELGSTGDPDFVKVQSKHAFLPYGLPPNYTPLNENVNNSTIINEDTKESPISALNCATNHQIKTNPQLVQ